MVIRFSTNRDPNQAYWKDAEEKSKDQRELMKQQMNKIHGRFEHQPGRYKKPTFWLWILFFMLIIGTTVLGIFLLGKNPEEEGYVLSFETFDGTTIEPQTYAYRDQIILPDNPTKEGYIFAGWYIDDDYVQPLKANHVNAYIFMSDMTIYAKWVQQQMLVTLGFNPVGGNPVDPTILPFGSSLSSIITAKEGHYFGGWANNLLGKTITRVPDFNGTLYAMWDPLPMRPIGETNDIYQVPISGNEGDTFLYVDGGFWISETEMTYHLWYEVYQWAINHGYQFSHQGRDGMVGFEGTTPRLEFDYPVTTISYYDALIWLNALSERESLDPVYRNYNSNLPIEDISEMNLVYMSDHNGYRLPTFEEWEMAARLTKEIEVNDQLIKINEFIWIKDTLYSGITSSLHEAVDYAWLLMNSDEKIASVGLKLANPLGLYDMSGNVCEYVYGIKQQQVMCMGGSFLTNDTLEQIRYVHPNDVAIDQGFRIVRG